MSYYVVKTAFAARDFPSNKTGKQVVRLTAGQVVQYQEAQGLTVDGIVGENTWGKLLG